jgi:hypothetical protein
VLRVKTSGSFRNAEKFLKTLSSGDIYRDLDRFGREGVAALAAATPVDSGLTANSWGYNVVESKGEKGVEWYNSNVNNGARIAILLQYGHGTGTGGWVQGRDYINPAIQPIFDRMAKEIWKKVTNG